jgi:large subunit ribosomal protein L25
MSEPVIEVHKREEVGGGSARRLLREDKIAAVVYGGGRESVPITVDRKSLLDLFKSTGSDNAVFLLQMAGTKQQRHAMIRHMDIHPITRQIHHIDFLRILMDEKIKVEVPVELLGVPEGVKNEDGIVDFVTREVEVECLPGDIPRSLELDISALHKGQHVEAGDIPLPKGVTLAVEAERVIASVTTRRKAEVEAEEEEEELLIEAEQEEPEVIRRGKTEEEEGGEA